MIRAGKIWQVFVFAGISALVPHFALGGESWNIYPLRPTTAQIAPIQNANLSFRQSFPFVLRSNPETRPTISVLKPATNWRTNPAAIAIIKNAEKLRLSAYYLAGQWLVGYGHAGDTTADTVITPVKAEFLLRDDLSSCENMVGQVVSVPVTRNEFSALVALCYNIGIGNLAKSLTVQHLNQGHRRAAADAFLYWKRASVADQPRVLTALVDRRKRERALFLKDQPAIRFADKTS